MKLESKNLKELALAKMHFGKHKGKFLTELPENYLLWFKLKGFPENKLGLQMQEILELKMNGLEGILRKIRNQKL